MSEDLTLGDLLAHIDRRFDKVDVRFDTGEKRFDKIENAQERTNEHLARLNGQVAKNVAALGVHGDRLDALEAANQRSEDVARGRREQRADDLERIKTVRDTLTDFWPLVLGAILGGVGVGSFLWGVFR